MRLPRVKSVVVSAIGFALPLLLGLGCFFYPFSERLGTSSWFTRVSYDVPFLLRANLDTREVVIVYLDEQSAKEMQQPLDQAWDRRLHARLLDRLKAEGARAVLFDIVFSSPSADPAADEEFAAAIKRHGTVILGASMELSKQLGTRQRSIYMPIPDLRRAAAGRGLLELRPIDPDYAVRQIYNGIPEIASATWVLAEKLGAPTTQAPRDNTHWLNYYGPRDTFKNVSFAQALLPDGVPPGFFKEKIVFIGGRPAVSHQNVGKDEFATPYSRWNRFFTTGVEIHATTLLNLLRNETLTRMPHRVELGLIIAFGILAGSLRFFRPDRATLLGVVLILLIACVACALMWQQRVWFAWMIPAAVQIPAGLAWSVGWQYFVEARRRAALRRAFSFYLSPHMADRISDANFDLTPGGKIVDASIVFTDLKGFTALSEDLGSPDRLSEILIAYFNNTTRSILENNGTIIKYIGDAVFAAWGAPLVDKDHAYKAALAAWQINQASQIEVSGRVLTTRIGVNCGNVLAGNLGSDFRFDYTLIGDAVNFASRLEGLNKYLGTQVLMSDAIFQRAGHRFHTRALGEFLVVGKTQAVAIHELICPRSNGSQDPPWCEPFAAALSAMKRSDFAAARRSLHETIAARNGEDGPAAFYLKKLAELESAGELMVWTGAVTLTEK